MALRQSAMNSSRSNIVTPNIEEGSNATEPTLWTCASAVKGAIFSAAFYLAPALPQLHPKSADIGHVHRAGLVGHSLCLHVKFSAQQRGHIDAVPHPSERARLVEHRWNHTLRHVQNECFAVGDQATPNPRDVLGRRKAMLQYPHRNCHVDPKASSNHDVVLAR